jgi:hypothetical protein
MAIKKIVKKREEIVIKILILAIFVFIFPGFA